MIIVEALRFCELGFEELPLSNVAHPIVSLMTMGFMYLLPPSRSIPRTPLSLQIFFSLSKAACAVPSHKFLHVLTRLLPPPSLQLPFPLKCRLCHHLPTRIAVNRVCQKVEARVSAVLESAQLHMIFLDKRLLYFCRVGEADASLKMHAYFPTHSRCVGFHSLERKHVQRAAQLNALTVNVLDGLNFVLICGLSFTGSHGKAAWQIASRRDRPLIANFLFCGVPGMSTRYVEAKINQKCSVCSRLSHPASLPQWLMFSE